jgi:nucleoside-diphosphate-sugar epimerase
MASATNNSATTMKTQATAASDSAAAASAAPSSRRLLVVGPGVLGAYAGLLWRQAFPDAEVVAQTNSSERHPRLRDAGLTPRVRPSDFAAAAAGAPAAAALPESEKFPFVLFAAPPSGSDDYAREVAATASRWDGTGCMVFTSSMSVCAVEDGSDVDEACPLVAAGADAKTDRLLSAERACLDAGGCVLRLVGLYHATRGPHSFFFKVGEVPRFGGYSVNMLHYEDAASLAVAIMKGGVAGDGGEAGAGGAGGGAAAGQQPANSMFRGEIFLGCDNHPLTFDEMVRACESSGLAAYQPPGKVKFTGPPPPEGAAAGRGKRANNDATRRRLGGWTPKYDSFEAFFSPEGAHGKDWYGSDEGGKGQW